MPSQEAPFTLNGLAPQLGTELCGGHDTVCAGLGRGKVNTVAGMNQCRRGGFRTVDGELGGDGGGAIEHIAPPVYPKQQVFAAAADEIGIAVPIHHQQLQHRKAPAAEELGGAPVEQHLITVADKAEAGRDSDTERGGIFRIRQREGIGVGAGLKITSCQRCAFGIYAEGRGHPGTEGGELAPTAAKKTAEGGPPLTWQMRCAISSARAWMGPSRREKSSSAGKVCSNPRISVKLTLLLRPSSSFMASAVGKSTKACPASASVFRRLLR